MTSRESHCRLRNTDQPDRHFCSIVLFLLAFASASSARDSGRHFGFVIALPPGGKKKNRGSRRSCFLLARLASRVNCFLIARAYRLEAREDRQLDLMTNTDYTRGNYRRRPQCGCRKGLGLRSALSCATLPFVFPPFIYEVAKFVGEAHFKSLIPNFSSDGYIVEDIVMRRGIVPRL